MKIKEHNYLKVFLLFSFLFLINVYSVNAIATFTDIPDQKFEFNYFREINLFNYCSTCVNDAYVVQFRNPDTNQLVTLFGDVGGEHSNSYFTIRLINGLVSMTSNFKELNSQVTVFGADTPFLSQASETFFIDIASNQKPEQIASPLNPHLLGNQSFSYSMNGFWFSYDTIRVEYEDFFTATSVSLYANRTQTSQANCINGDLRVCIASNGQNVIVTFTGLNKTITNKTVMVTASNAFGDSILAGGLFVTTQVQGAIAVVPSRLPLSLAPITLGFYDSSSRNLKLFWGNATYYNATFAYGNNATNVTITSISGGGIFQSSYFDIILSQDEFYIASKDLEVNRSVFLIACNEAGCNSSNNRLDFSISIERPDLVFNAPPIVMNIGDVLTFDLNDYFDGNLTSYRAFVSAFNGNEFLGANDFVKSDDANNNVTTNFSSEAGIRGMTMTADGLWSIYAGNVSYNNVTGVHFKYYIVACNILCYVGDPSNPSHVYNMSNDTIPILNGNVILIYSDGTTSYGESIRGASGIGGLWGAVTRSFLDFFPPSNDLTSTQKSSYVIVFMIIVSMLMIFMGWKFEMEAMNMFWVVGILNFFLLLFFIVKGYATAFSLVTIVILSLGLVSAKVFGGKG